MNFETFQNSCKHRKPGYDIDRQPVDTCRHKENTPPGSSWGTCGVEYCPMVKAQCSKLMTAGDFIRMLDNNALAILLTNAMDAAVDRFIEVIGIQHQLEENGFRKKQNVENIQALLDSPLEEGKSWILSSLL